MALEGQQTLAGDGPEIAHPQGAVAAAQRDQLARPLQLGVVVVHQVPAHRCAHLRVVAAGHAQLAAVIEVGRAGQRELQHLGQPALRPLRQRCGQPRRVVVVQVDPALEQGVDAAIDHHALDHAPGGGAVQPAVTAAQDDLAQGEVHYRVDRHEPLGRVAGDLTDHQRTRLLVVRGGRQLCQVAVADVHRHVQPPAVGAMAQVAAHRRIG